MAIVIECYTENGNRGKCNQFKVINEKSALQRKKRKKIKVAESEFSFPRHNRLRYPCHEALPLMKSHNLALVFHFSRILPFLVLFLQICFLYLQSKAF